MPGLIKISDACTLALHAMAYLAARPEEGGKTKDIAETYYASQAHMSKVLQRLSRAGMVNATRGPGGGFKLAKDPEDITLLDVYECMEGPMKTSTCLLSRPVCGRHRCILGNLVHNLNKEAKRYFSETKLADLFQPDERAEDDEAENN